MKGAMKPKVGYKRKKDSHVSPASRKSAFSNSAFTVLSTSFLPGPLQHEVMSVMNSESKLLLLGWVFLSLFVEGRACCHSFEKE